jgi:hypothetical protein
MDWISLSIGGVVGALAAFTLGAVRVRAAFLSFGTEFREYMRSRTDADSLALSATFEELSLSISLLSAAFERLKRALGRK